MEQTSDEERTAEELKAERRRVREERKRRKAEREEAERLRIKAERLADLEVRRKMLAIERDHLDDAEPEEIEMIWRYIRAADRCRGVRPYFMQSLLDAIPWPWPWRGRGRRWELFPQLESRVEALGLIRRVKFPPSEWYPDNRRVVIVRAGLSSAPVARTDAEADALEAAIVKASVGQVFPVLEWADVDAAIAKTALRLRAYDPDDEGRNRLPFAPTRTIEAATTAELIAELAKRFPAQGARRDGLRRSTEFHARGGEEK
jgi:hypothetical protein